MNIICIPHVHLPDTVRFICEANGYDAEKIGQHFLEILPKICPPEQKYIEPCCDIGKSLLEISIFPFVECTPYAHPQVSVCRVQGIIHLYAS